VSSDSYGRRIVNWTGDWIENDVKDDQKNDHADSSALLLLLTVHGKTPFRACFF
jgi:hypothetical protein